MGSSGGKVQFDENVTTVDVERVGRITKGISWRASGHLIECDECCDVLPYRFKVVMMDEDAFVRFASMKGVPEKNALDMWFTQTECPKRWDMNGRDGSLRIAFNIIEDVQHVKRIRGSAEIGSILCKVDTFHCTKCLVQGQPNLEDAQHVERVQGSAEIGSILCKVGTFHCTKCLVQPQANPIQTSHSTECRKPPPEWPTATMPSDPWVRSGSPPASAFAQPRPVSLGAFVDDTC